jgi:hypothetical protein
MNQRLRGIISTLHLDESLKKLTSAFAQHFGSNEKGTLMSDLHAFGSSPNPALASEQKLTRQERLGHRTSELLEAYEEQQALRASPGTIYGHRQVHHSEAAGAKSCRRGIRLGVKHNSFGRGCITFSSFNHIRRNSYIAVGRNIPDGWYAGRIQEIFTYTHRGPIPEMVHHTVTYFVVEKFKELTEADALHDPYRKQPFIAGRLYYEAFEDDLELIPLQDICCHLALTPFRSTFIEHGCIHALPLDRVCYAILHLQGG